MQKLIIHEPFMGVQPCEIEIGRFLLLIGEQASGKSTIAKLIYFFNTLPDLLYDLAIAPVINNSSSQEIIGHTAVTTAAIWDHFDWFFNAENNFNITFQYHSLKTINISKNKKEFYYRNVEAPLLIEPVQRALEIYWNNNSTTDIGRQAELRRRKELKDSLNQLFERQTTDHTFMVTGRGLITSHPRYFEGRMEVELEKLLEEEVKQQHIERKQRTGNERLLLSYIEWSRTVREYFGANNSSSFEALLQEARLRVPYEPAVNLEALSKIAAIAQNILKGFYQQDQHGNESILVEDGTKVPMKDASSGQQEVLRILQGLFLSVRTPERREFFVVEEPESHLYPLAQKELINAFVLFLNTIQEGRLIITTHSPYILACLNILLYAHYAAHEIPAHSAEIAVHTPQHLWLDSQIFTAYSLGQAGEYCVNIKDPETGLIDQNYLDLISEQLGMTFQQIYHLLTKHYA